MRFLIPSILSRPRVYGISYYGFIPEQIFLKLVENDLSNGPTTQGVFGMMENIFTQNIKKNVSDTNSSKNENSSD